MSPGQGWHRRAKAQKRRNVEFTARSTRHYVCNGAVLRICAPEGIACVCVMSHNVGGFLRISFEPGRSHGSWCRGPVVLSDAQREELARLESPRRGGHRRVGYGGARHRFCAHAWNSGLVGDAASDSRAPSSLEHTTLCGSRQTARMGYRGGPRALGGLRRMGHRGWIRQRDPKHCSKSRGTLMHTYIH